MDNDANINLRLPAEWKERAERVAKACGSTLSLVLRLLLERFVEHAESHNMKIVMPPEFVEYKIAPKDMLAVAEQPPRYSVDELKRSKRVRRPHDTECAE